MTIEKNVIFAEKTAKYATILTIILVVSKFFVGVLVNSLALKTDALHSLSDVILIGITWVSLKLFSTRPNEKFPYGLYKVETFVSFLISIFILISGSFFIWDAFRGELSQISNLPLAASVALFSAISSGIISHFEFKAASRLDSKAMELNAKESLMDVITSLLVFFAVVSGVPLADKIVGSLIGILVIKIGVEGVYNSSIVLLDIWKSPETEKGIRKIVESRAECKSIKLRKAGPFIFAELVIGLPKGTSVLTASSVSEEISKEVKRNFPQVIHSIIKVEPSRKREFWVAVPTDDKKTVSIKTARAKYIYLAKIKDKRIIKEEIISNPAFRKKIRAGLSFAKLLAKKADVVILENVGEIAFSSLQSNLVEMYRGKGSISKNLKLLIDGKLIPLSKPTKEIEGK